MPSMLVLRTLLLACAVSGTLVIACSESSPSGTNSRGDDDSDDDDTKGDDDNADDDEDDDQPSGRRDAGRNDGGRRDSGSSSSGCPTIPIMQCMNDEGERGISMCDPSTGEFGECTTITGADAGTVDECPEPFMCSTTMLGSFCTMGGGGLGGVIMCSAASDCEDQGLTGGTCTMFGGFGVCQLRCVPGSSSGGNDAGTGGEDEESDAGEDEEEEESDAGTGGGSSDAGRADSGRDR